MIALIGLIFSSIFRGNNGDGLVVIGMLELCLFDWWFFPLLFTFLKK